MNWESILAAENARLRQHIRGSLSRIEKLLKSLVEVKAGKR